MDRQPLTADQQAEALYLLQQQLQEAFRGQKGILLPEFPTERLDPFAPQLLRRIGHNALCLALAALPGHALRALSLTYLQGRRYSGAAKALGIDRATVRRRCDEGLALLAARFYKERWPMSDGTGATGDTDNGDTA
jgi:DNA-directed RNA polymerase specialized sigma24 family protein